MNQAFALDLAAARRKSGLAQKDCAHLMNIHTDRVSRLEAGKHTPTLKEFCKLSLIYGRPFENLFSDVMEEARAEVRAQLPSLPEGSSRLLSRFNRNNTLNRLAAHLEENHRSLHGGA